MNELINSFAKAGENLTEFKEIVEQHVTRWTYSVGAIWHQFPDTAHMLSRYPNRIFSAATGASWANGYDKAGRLIIMKEINQPRSGKEVFIAYERDRGSGVELNNGTLSSVFHIALEDGLTTEAIMQLEAQTVTYGYRWENDQPAARTTKFSDGDIFEDIVDKNWTVIEEWKIKPDGRRVPANPVLPKGKTLKSLGNDLRKRLPASIKTTLAKSRISKPVYCLCLAYDGENPGLSLACVGVGLESERKEFIAERTGNTGRSIWNPAEFAHYDKPNVHIVDEELQEISEWFNQLVDDKDSVAPVRTLLLDVAAQLAKEDLSKSLNLTPDFAVFAVDYHLNDLQKNLKKTVPAELIKRFKKNGSLE